MFTEEGSVRLQIGFEIFRQENEILDNCITAANHIVVNLLERLEMYKYFDHPDTIFAHILQEISTSIACHLFAATRPSTYWSQGLYHKNRADELTKLLGNSV